MKKILLSRRNALLSKNSLPIGGSIVAAALLIVALRVVAPGALLSAAAPLLRAGAAASTFATDLRASFADSAALARERDSLRSENDLLSRKNLALTAELEDLTKAAVLGGTEQGILAGILARPPQTGYDVLLVSAGGTTGISKGMHAYVGAIPVGTVESVTGASARITLFTAPGAVTPAWVGEKRLAITLSGVGGAFVATAPKEAGISIGDTVYAPGPGALPVGRIAGVESSASSPRIVLQITPLVNLFSITWVRLVP